MTLKLTMFVCDESQGPVFGESFGECLCRLFELFNRVPEQFPTSYVDAAMKCLSQITKKIEDGHLPADYNDFLHSEAWAGTDFIEITLSVDTDFSTFTESELDSFVDDAGFKMDEAKADGTNENGRGWIDKASQRVHEHLKELHDAAFSELDNRAPETSDSTELTLKEQIEWLTEKHGFADYMNALADHLDDIASDLMGMEYSDEELQHSANLATTLRDWVSKIGDLPRK